MSDSPRLRLSILDLAVVAPGQAVAEALGESLALARTADDLGRFERIWFAEHHNMSSIASAATAVLIGQTLAHTRTIRVGSGGVMLPNHAPLVIAEQFGTLAELYPGRVDLGLGRAPGTDQVTLRALRRDPRASDDFPQDIRELQAYLSDEGGANGVNAHPGRGTKVPLWILGSSLFGAQLAAAYGLPYAFASHFAPDALLPAMQAYRAAFQPSAQLDQPYAVAALNVVAADSPEDAGAMAQSVLRARVRSLASRHPGFSGPLDDATLDGLIGSPLGQQAAHMLTYTAVGDRAAVEGYLHAFAEQTGADELIVTNAAPRLPARTRALQILAEIG